MSNDGKKCLSKLGGRGEATAMMEARIGLSLDFAIGPYNFSYFTTVPQARAIVEFGGKRYVVERSGEAGLNVLGAYRAGTRRTGFEYDMLDDPSMEVVARGIYTELSFGRLHFVDAEGGLLRVLKDLREGAVQAELRRMNVNN